MEESAIRSATLTTVKIVPVRSLAPFVEYLRVVSHVPDAEPYVRLPDGRLELLVRRAIAGPSLTVVGPRLSPLRKTSGPIPEAFHVRFKTGGAYPFFGVPIAELADQVVPLELLPGSAAELLGLALEEPTTAARVSALQHALCARLGAPLCDPASAPLAGRALRLLAASTDLPRVDAWAARLGVSQRHLRRAFGELVGLTPKAYLRIARFQRALRQARRAPSESWSRIARTHGYYDQAHMIAEFRALSGRTPAMLR